MVVEARRWIGVKWHHQGRSRQGVDCLGLCVCAARNIGVILDDQQGYARRADGSALVARLEAALGKVPSVSWMPGDIGLFRDGGFPIHLGVLASQGNAATVIHAHARRRKVIEENLDIFGAPIAVFRLRENG